MLLTPNLQRLRANTRKNAARMLFAAAVLLAAAAARADTSPAGLWVGEVTLNRVNETVVGIDAANQVVAADPSVTTPVKSPAHIRIIFHVDANGQVRLLKNVAILNKSTSSNQPPVVALVTDPSLYPNYASIGKRVASAAFDFGDANAAQIVNLVASNAAVAAASGADAAAAANQVVQHANLDNAYSTFVHGAAFNLAALGAAQSASAGAAAREGNGGTPAQVLADALSGATNDSRVVAALATATSLQSAALLPDTRYVGAVNAVALAAANAAAAIASTGISNLATIGVRATNAALLAETNTFYAPSPFSPGYDAFVSSPTFQSSAQTAASAATAAAQQASQAGATSAQVFNQANAAALKSLSDAGLVAAADGIVDTEVLMSGNIVPQASLSGTIYLGASHPTNPFRHRMNPDHTVGYAITRKLSVQFDPPNGTNALQTVGFGVERITGTYREEIFGLHKPLGPSQNIGLITDGTISLDHVSPVDTLNH